MQVKVGDTVWYNITDKHGCNLTIISETEHNYIVRVKRSGYDFVFSKSEAYKLEKERKEIARRPPKRTTNYNGIRRKKAMMTTVFI